VVPVRLTTTVALPLDLWETVRVALDNWIAMLLGVIGVTVVFVPELPQPVKGSRRQKAGISRAGFFICRAPWIISKTSIWKFLFRLWRCQETK
jgi:hypothetical protein